MSPPLQIGEVLRDRYKITAYVGQGGMGSIYQAEDLRLEDACAQSSKLRTTAR